MRRGIGWWIVETFLEPFLRGLLWLFTSPGGWLTLLAVYVLAVLYTRRRDRIARLTTPHVATVEMHWTASQRSEWAADLPRKVPLIRSANAHGTANEKLAVIVSNARDVRPALSRLSQDSKARGFHLIEFFDEQGTRIEGFLT